MMITLDKGMQSSPVVKYLNIFEDIPLSFLSGMISGLVN